MIKNNNTQEICKSDYHIHTSLHPWDDGSEDMTPAMIGEMAVKMGYTEIGLSPHCHWHDHGKTAENTDELISKLLTAKQLANEIIPTLAGVETECIDADATLTINAKQIEKLDYIIASPDHYNCVGVVKPPKDLKQMLTFHQHQLISLAQNPLVDVIAHPWTALILLSCDGHLPDYPKLHNLKAIPENWHHELAQQALKNNTAIEINGFFVGYYLQKRSLADNSYEKEYLRFFEIMVEAGVKISPNSDAHSPEKLKQANDAWMWANEKLKIKNEQIWRPQKSTLK